jgi:hypothetical protein
MKKENDPSFNGSPSPNSRLPYFSNLRPLVELEYFTLRLACLTEFKETEPQSVTRARSRIEKAEKTLCHFQGTSFPPIFDSFEYEGLRMKGIK